MNLLYKNKYKNKYKKIIISLDKKEKRTFVLGVKKFKKRGSRFFCSRNIPIFPSFFTFLRIEQKKRTGGAFYDENNKHVCFR